MSEPFDVRVTESEEIAETVAAPTYSPRAPLMEFPFPLRDNVDVFLRLPRDLTKDEASRLSGFIESLAGGGRSPEVPHE